MNVDAVELEHQEGAAIVVLVLYSRSQLKKKIVFGQISGGTGNSSRSCQLR
jgi:hypothetical protein